MPLRPLLASVLLLASLSLAGVTPTPSKAPAAAEEKKSPAPGAVADPVEAIRAETAKLQAEREKLQAEMDLAEAQLDKKLAPKKLAMIEMQTQMEELKARMDMTDMQRRSVEDPKVVELRRENERLLLETSLAKNQVDKEGYDMRKEENIVRKKTNALALQIELQQKETEARTYASGKAPSYLKDPLQGKKLVLSDRCIPLNGVVTGKTADNVVERINYYNNRDREAPIFLVIDDCPGGSVMAGYKIMKAMHGSQAPVYTVVKSFAASLAACLTTLAERSFAYPNAIILHHQLSAIGMGNLTQQREAVKELEEWWKRLADPIAQKMGITREEFIARMYQKSSTGDWNEFADDAQKLKWVDVIVDEIEETALLRHPDTQPQVQAPAPVRSEGEVGAHVSSPDVISSADERGKPIALLPRLNPLDAYWLYNPDSYFRMQ
ncbi:MAG: ATP-dependent Clp protease proteolytic subunit [Prosthecobacter sp.]|nr:ATP-dependent Clp protease proteolytic subunit [Prosthecobacter sp.]